MPAAGMTTASESTAPAADRPAEPARGDRAFRASHTSTFRYSALVAALVVMSGLVVVGFSCVLAALWERHQEAGAQQEFDRLLGVYAHGGFDALVSQVDERSARAGSGGWLQRITTAAHVYALAPPRAERTVAGNLPAWPTGIVDIGPRRIAFAVPGAGILPAELHQIRASTATLPDGTRLLVGRDVELAERVAHWLEGALVWLLTFGLPSGTLGGWVASRRMLGRIDELRRNADRIMAGDITHRMPLSRHDDEFDRLAATLNRMLAEIEGLMRTVRRVTDDIAHDLRSPLTRVRQQLDLALRERRPEAAREVIAEAVADVDRLLSTFNALLTIATVDAGSVRVDVGRVPLDGLLRDLDDLYRPMSDDRAQTLVVMALPGIAARANRQLLFQALANLVENAIKYAPRGGRVEVTARDRTDGIQVVVADDGPGIAAPDRARVLEPFVRLDQSRGQPGNGLGLALVAAICKFHRARLILGDNKPGLRVCLLLPRAD